jgi:hypothetical protein
MREVVRSPSEFYIRFLISREEELPEDPEELRDFNTDEIRRALDGLGLDGLSPSYIREVARTMIPRPDPYVPDNAQHVSTKKYLREHKIYDMWHPTPGVREALLILADSYLREKLEPLLLSSMTHTSIARKLRKYTSIALTAEGISAFGHYFWNRRLLTQQQWMEYLRGISYNNPYIQGLLTPTDMVHRHLPWVVGVTGPRQDFNSAEAAARIGQIAFKHALELEHQRATMETTMALKNCMLTIEKADVIMRRSDVALRDVLKQFQKFRMKLDDAKIIDVKELTDGNFSKSGEGTDIEDEEDF